MQEEIWKTVSVNDKYEVSNTGKVRPKNPRYKNVTELKPINAGTGYYRVSLDRKLYSVHRLVAQAFLDNPDGLPEVNHKDENPSNNNVENLEWCTTSYNQSYSKSYNRYLINPDGEPVTVFNLKEFCRNNGLNCSNILRVLKGIRPHHKGWRAAK